MLRLGPTVLLLFLALRHASLQNYPDDDDYEIPRPRIVAFSPRGLRISIPDEDGIELFSVRANINRRLGVNEAGMIGREIRTPRNGRWIMNEPRIALSEGDILHYRMAVRRYGENFYTDHQTFRIRGLHALNGQQVESIVWPGSSVESHPPNHSVVSKPPSVRPPQIMPRPPATTAKPPPRPAAAAVRPPGRPPPRPAASNTPKPSCAPSLTIVQGKAACKGQLIFQDNFDELDMKKWQHNIRFADEPDFEFVIYDNRAENSFVADGLLHIRPSLTERTFGRPFMNQGNLTLEDCTATTSEECSQTAAYGLAMPAVLSSRLRTNRAFSFKYGRIEVRAKMAAGDWLLSSIMLQPLRNSYGPRYESGQVRVAMARGNRDLTCDEVSAGVTQLEAGVLLSAGEDAMRRSLGSRDLPGEQGWHQDFHVFKTEWTPEKLTFYVDGKVITTVSPPPGGFGSLEEFAENPTNHWASGTKLAPFDKEFYIALSVAAGGIHDFPDTCTNNGQPKPWTNGHPKAKLKFWQKQSEWSSTWVQGEDVLQVDYVKVWAL